MPRDKATIDALADAFIAALTDRVKTPGIATAAELEIIRKVCNEAGIKWVPTKTSADTLEVPDSILNKLPFTTGKDGEVLIPIGEESEQTNG